MPKRLDRNTLAMVGVFAAYVVVVFVVQLFTEATWPLAVPTILFGSALLLLGRPLRWYQWTTGALAILAISLWCLAMLPLAVAGLIAIGANTASSAYAQRHSGAQ